MMPGEPGVTAGDHHPGSGDGVSREQLVRQARAWLASYQMRRHEAGLPATPAPASMAHYQKNFARLNREALVTGETVSQCAARTGLYNSWRTLRTGYYWSASQLLVKLLSGAGAADEIARLALLMKSLASFVKAPPHLQRARRSRRRFAIRGLPEDWREQLASRMTSHDRLAYLVAAVTGCRPVELVLGIDVALTQGSGERILAIRIQGAKCTERSGQPQRILAFAADAAPLTRDIADELMTGAAGTDGVWRREVRVANARVFSHAITRRARRLWPQRSLSAYSLRYAFCGDLRKTDIDRVTRAKAMGHVSDLSQNYYRTGRRRQSASGIPRLLVVDAPRAVRQYRRWREREAALTHTGVGVPRCSLER